MINDIKKSGKCKHYLTMKIKIISSKDSNEKLLMHPESDSRDIMTSFDTYNKTEQLFDSFFNKCHKITLNLLDHT